MKYTNSKDGIKRTSIRVIIRLDEEDIEFIRRTLKERGEPTTDAAVREFVNSRTEYEHQYEHEDIPREKWNQYT